MENNQSMINIPMDGREIEILKNLLELASKSEVSKFKIAEYSLLINKLDSYKKEHHGKYSEIISKRFENLKEQGEKNSNG